MKRSPFLTTVALLTATGAGVALGLPGGATASGDSRDGYHGRDVKVTILAPREHDVVGIGAAAWAIDVRIDVKGEDALARSGSPVRSSPGRPHTRAPPRSPARSRPDTTS